MIIAIVEENTLVVSVKTFAVSITAKEIEPYFHALTHFPERRSNRELHDLADRLNTFAATSAISMTKANGRNGSTGKRKSKPLPAARSI
ncbi:hypothetical protein ACNSPG_23305 (plasmid) [Brucella pituitosa]|uniref:hypothetical protein n=1 Tax=Brucella pituitosa TaxID=571256 RepID=UPI003C74CC53